MLSKKERLDRRSFNRSFSMSERVHSRYFTAFVSPSPSFKGACVVSKKIAKKAVERNALRRRVYAEMRIIVREKEYPLTCILIMKKESYGTPSAEIGKEIKSIVAQALK